MPDAAPPQEPGMTSDGGQRSVRRRFTASRRDGLAGFWRWCRARATLVPQSHPASARSLPRPPGACALAGRPRRQRRRAIAGVTLLFAALVPAPAIAAPLVGEAAFGDWRQDAPGLARLIRPQDLPPPGATPSASNGPSVIPRPAGATLRVPPGFRAALWASGFDTPRSLRVAPDGDVFLAESGAGQIRVLRPGAGSTHPASDAVFAAGLDEPFGIAFWPPGPAPRYVYIGETNRVVRYPYMAGALHAAGPAEVIVPHLPEGGHWTRDLAFSPDGHRLYVAVGSLTNSAAEMRRSTPDGRAAAASDGLGAAWGGETDRADVLVFDPDGGGRRHLANGLRNCSALTIRAPETVWCATNERDGLGDNLPPDYVTRVRPGGFYGWPWYYIGSHPDPRHRGERPDLAGRVDLPDVLLQAHSAPLGMTFYDGALFPPEYRGDAFVALHGSWNRARRTGYKVVRVRMSNGVPTGVYEDFLLGFVTPQGVWGRPVGLAVLQDGSLLVSEDANGTIWRVSRTE